MKTTNIYLTAADNSYTQCIDNLNEEITADSYEIETINEEEKTMKTTNTMTTNATMTTDNFEGLQIAADALRQSYDRLADHAGSPAQVAIVKALNEIADIIQTAGENDYNPDEKYTPAEYAELIADLVVEYTSDIR